MNAPQPRFKSPAACRAWMRANGINVAEWAREHGFDRYTVVGLLRGTLKGERGEAHRAAVALGLKADHAAVAPEDFNQDTDDTPPYVDRRTRGRRKTDAERLAA